MIQQKITPFLWYDDKAEEAANFYVSLFENSKVNRIARYTEIGPGPAGSVMTVEFQLAGQEFIALNGGPHFKLNESFSLQINCESQEEVDRLWEKLSEGGSKSQCGWLKDRYGLSWQVVPTVLPELLASNETHKVNRVMLAMLQMTKLEIAKLKAAAEGQ